MIKKNLKSLARIYCMLILGLGSTEYHHMMGGKKRVSCGFKDRGIFETLYPFCTFFVWITFKRRDYEIIHHEIGRMLRSEAFSNSMKFDNISEDGKFSKDLILSLSLNLQLKFIMFLHFICQTPLKTMLINWGKTRKSRSYQESKRIHHK